MEGYMNNGHQATGSEEEPERWASFEDAAEAEGFAMIPNAVLRSPGLSVTAKVAYALLKSYAWQDPHAFPGQKRMMQELNVGEHTLRAALQELKDSGLLNIKRRGQGRTNLYTFRRLEPSTSGSNTRTGAVPKAQTVAVPKAQTGADNEYAGEEYTAGEESGDKPRNALALFRSMMGAADLEVTPEDEERVRAPLEKVAGSCGRGELAAVVSRMVGARSKRGYQLGPQQAINDVRSGRTDGYAVEPSSTTVQAALQADPTTSKYAYTSLEWDFAREKLPPTRVLLELGNLPDERTKTWKRMRRVAREAEAKAKEQTA